MYGVCMQPAASLHYAMSRTISSLWEHYLGDIAVGHVCTYRSVRSSKLLQKFNKELKIKVET